MSIQRGNGNGDDKRDITLPKTESTSTKNGAEKRIEEKRGEKRKFSLDGDEVARIAEEERAKARRAIEDEKVCLPLLLPPYIDRAPY